MLARRSQAAGGAACSLLALLLTAACSEEASDSPPVEETQTLVERREAFRKAQRAGRSNGSRPAHAEYAGRWRPARDAAVGTQGTTPEQREQFERLRAIGYVGGSVKSTREGLTAYARDAVEPGLNFFTSGHGPTAVLMDMRGKVLHEWHKEFSDVWPKSPDRRRPHSKWWRRAHLFENGDVLAIYEGLGIIKLNRDSEVIWANDIWAHHDLDVRPNGDIWVLSRDVKKRPDVGDLILEDFLVVLGADGTVKRSVSILEALRRSEFAHLIALGKRSTGDILHTNTIHVLDGRLGERHPAFRAGAVLTSMNALGVIAVLDPEREEITWARRGDWDNVKLAGQHDPQILDDGSMIYFDNHYRRRQSRVLVVDPVSGEELWSYRGNKATPFYSALCGAVQSLPNGNVLITESDSGRAFEVDDGGRIAWEYYNPRRAGESNEFIATISEMIRLPLDYADSWLP